jgi:2-methylcitrate dehydratase PrpD
VSAPFDAATHHAGAPRATTAEDAAAVIARFACALSVETLPPAVIAAVKTNILDTLACAVAGSSAAGTAEAYELVTEWGGAPQATILALGGKVPAHHAAWVNGIMAHARDYDDTHDGAILHAGVSVVPAALAAAELKRDATGADLVAGVAAGLETMCRLGVATRIGIIESGFIYSSLLGYFGATVAAGRVLGLDHAQMVNAIGIAYSQVAGNHQVTRDGALTKRMQPGFAAKAALVSVQLARKNVRGAQGTFDGTDGFVRVYLRDRFDGAVLRAALGERYELMELSYKPYPCCRFNHTAIDAALELREFARVAADDIRAIRAGVNRQAYEAVCTPVDVRKAPQSVVQAQFSIPFTVATALIDGAVGLRHFTDEGIRRTDILALAQRVDASVDDQIEREWSRSISPTELCIEMKDGSARSVRVDLPSGHPQRPMSSAAIDAKLSDCARAAARPLPDGAMPRLRRTVNDLERWSDVSALVGALTG